MENSHKKYISQKEKEDLLNSLNSLFADNPSNYGYKYDIDMTLKSLGIKDYEYFSQVIESFSKKERNNDDLLLISSYLFFMQEFIKLLKARESYKNELKLLDYLLNLSSSIYYTQIQKNEILMKYGDKGDKAYINLNGDVDVIIPSSKLFNVCENDYLLYLASLIKYKEYYIINCVLNENFLNYPLIIYDDFNANDEIPSIFDIIKMSKKKISTFLKRKNNEITKILLDAGNIINHIKQRLERKKSKKYQLKSKENEQKDIKNEKIVQTSSLQQSFQLTSSNEDLVMQLELYIISTRQIFGLFDLDFFNDNDEEINHCSSEEYINRINAPITSGQSKVKKTKTNSDNSLYELNIYFYSKVISLGKGHFFGELALRDSKSVRTATIITKTDCDFAYLNRKTYNNSLKTNTELHLKNQLTFFINLPIFVDIPIILFYKKYYTHMSKHTVMKNKFVIKQGEKPTQLSLLNKGSFELICCFNLKELTQLILHFIEKSKNYQSNSEQLNSYDYKDILIPLKESIEEEKKLLIKNSNFKSLYSKEVLMKISEMSCPDIVGFEEVIGKDNLYAFSLKAKTTDNIIYFLDFNFYQELYERNPFVQKRHNHIIKIKLDMTIKRLVRIRNNFISSFLNHKTEDELQILVSKEIDNIHKVKKTGRRYLHLKNTKCNISFDIKDFNNKEKDLFNKKFTFHKIQKKVTTDKKLNLSKKFKTQDLIKIGEESKNEKGKNNKKESLNKTIKKFILNKNLKYMNANEIPNIKLSNFIRDKKFSPKRKEKIIFNENNKSVKGRKINECMKCYFDKKIKIADSINLTEKLRKKRIESKLENYKLNSIMTNKKGFFECFTENSDNERKKIIEHNEDEKYIFLERLLTPKNVKLSTFLLTNKSINLSNKTSFFQNKIDKMINTTKSKENKKKRIEEILKENTKSKEINDTGDEIEKIKVYKRDNYYEKNLIRLKMFYGFNKK